MDSNKWFIYKFFLKDVHNHFSKVLKTFKWREKLCYNICKRFFRENYESELKVPEGVGGGGLNKTEPSMVGERKIDVLKQHKVTTLFFEQKVE